MLDKFHGEVDRPYVLMHHIYCLKLGEPILHENKFAKKRAEEKKREKEEKLRLLKEAESPAPAVVAAPRPARRRSLKAISAAAAFGGGARPRCGEQCRCFASGRARRGGREARLVAARGGRRRSSRRRRRARAPRGGARLTAVAGAAIDESGGERGAVARARRGSATGARPRGAACALRVRKRPGHNNSRRRKGAPARYLVSGPFETKKPPAALSQRRQPSGSRGREGNQAAPDAIDARAVRALPPRRRPPRRAWCELGGCPQHRAARQASSGEQPFGAARQPP